MSLIEKIKNLLSSKSYSSEQFNDFTNEVLTGDCAPEESSDQEYLKVIHDLHVHQIELEMQNDELRSLQLKLDVSNRRYFELYDLAPVGYCTFAGDNLSLIVETNFTFCEMLGLSHEKVLNTNITKYILAEDQDVYYFFSKNISKSLTTLSCNLRMSKNNGVIFWARFEGLYHSDGLDNQQIRIVISDASKREEELLQVNIKLENEIESRKKLEVSLKRSEAFAKAILNSGLSEISVIDRNSNIVAVNSPWLNFAMSHSLTSDKYINHSCVGLNYLEVCKSSMNNGSSDAEVAYDGIKAVLEGKLSHFKFVYSCPTNTVVRWFRMSVSPLKFESGGAVISHTDITEVVEKTELLRLANSELLDSNEKLESFNYSVSHDLRSPLNSMKSFSNVILKDKDSVLSTRSQDAILRVIKATDRMGLVIEGLINLSQTKHENVVFQSVDLSALCKGIAEDLQIQNPDQKISFIIEEDLKVNGDLRLLTILMTNLLNNAVKFSAKKSFSKIEFGRIILKDSAKEVFFIKDNGVGFDMRHADKLFRPFERLHGWSEFEGTGLGLTIVSRLIKCHLGEIWAESEPNLGATFFFTIRT